MPSAAVAQPALLDVVLRSVGAERGVVEHGGPLEQAELAGGQVVVVDRLRGDHRGVVEPDGRRVVLGLAAGVHDVERLVEGDVRTRQQVAGGVAGQHVQAGQSVPAQ